MGMATYLMQIVFILTHDFVQLKIRIAVTERGH